MLRSTGERRVLNYSVEIQGLFGKNRKPKFHLELLTRSLRIAAFIRGSSSSIDLGLSGSTCSAFGGARGSLREEPVSLTTYADGITTEVFTLTSHRYLHREVIP